MDKNEFFEQDELQEILGELEEEQQPVTGEGAPEEYAEPTAEAEEIYEEYEEEAGAESPGRRRVWPWVLLGVFLLLVGICAALGFYAYGEAKEMLAMAYELKDEAETAVDQARDMDFAALERTMATIDSRLDTVNGKMDEPLLKLAAKVPGPGDDLTKLRSLFGIWDNAYAGIITPALSVLQEHPLPDLEDPDVKALLKESDMMEAYVELALAVLPECERCMDDFCAIPELSVPQLEEKMAEVRELIGSVRPWLPLARDVLENAAVPAVETLKRQPLEKLKSSSESFDYIINTELVFEYLALAEQLIPLVEGWLEEVETLPELPVEKLNDVVDKVGEKADELLPLYHKAEKYIPLAKAYLDAEEAREYLLVIQNTAETRASGGFPGNMGVLYVRDGELCIGDFKSVFNLLERYVDQRDERVVPTQTELQLFYEYVYAPRDAGINPHFPRVAEIWSRSCKSPGRVERAIRDGVISISPTLVQDFLAVMDAELELSDGTVLNGENASRYLMHEFYIRFFNNWEQNVYTNNDECDALFAEAAKAVLEMAMNSLELDMIGDFIDVLDKHIDNRTMLFWLADPEGQAVIEELGASGALNSDPEKPEVGVYYSGTVSSKLGWYLDLDVEVGEGRQNGDAMTYPVTITMVNNLTSEEYATTSAWVVGTAVGSANPYIFVFAPAGGSVDNFVCSNGMGMLPGEYQGLDVGYYTWTPFMLGQTLVITCDVTTAPGVDAPLGVDKTATLSEYRQAA